VEILDENLIRFLSVSFCYLDASSAPSYPATNGTTANGADRFRQKPLRDLECEGVCAGLDPSGVTRDS
jgi:hypothetical protein